MNLEEGIEKLQDLKRYAYQPETEKANNALALGIEALSFYKIMKLKRYFNPDYLLPGETKE